jgi:hypothetical protein
MIKLVTDFFFCSVVSIQNSGECMRKHINDSITKMGAVKRVILRINIASPSLQNINVRLSFIVVGLNPAVLRSNVTEEVMSATTT